MGTVDPTQPQPQMIPHSELCVDSELSYPQPMGSHSMSVSTLCYHTGGTEMSEGRRDRPKTVYQTVGSG
jgi:hypothetical protein